MKVFVTYTCGFVERNKNDPVNHTLFVTVNHFCPPVLALLKTRIYQLEFRVNSFIEEDQSKDIE